MAKGKIIRCDRWGLLCEASTVGMAHDTVAMYRRLVNALCTVFLAHWDEVHAMPVQDLERYFHATSKNPDARYGAWFARHFHKVPSYLRRAATMAAHGHVSSFMSRYRAWQGGDRRTRAQRPPRWGTYQGWPTLYAANGGDGAMIRHDGDAVAIKLYDATTKEWVWKRAAVAVRGRRHGGAGLPLSPMLMPRGTSLSLGQAYEFPLKARPGDRETVLAVDLGVNKAATWVVTRSDGTVIARGFVSAAAHVDRRDKVLMQVREKARLTMGRKGKLSPGFCAPLYRRARGINLHIARSVSRKLLEVAKAHKVWCIVFEHLKGWRPRGGARRSNLRQKFHGWLHRALVKQVEASAEESRIGVSFVSPRGTSKWAYDGSGRVVREKWNYGRCRFKGGKQYNTDLSAAQNIAARYFVRLMDEAARKKMAEQAKDKAPGGRESAWAASGRRSEARKRASSGAAPRMPAVLATLWETTGARPEIPTTAASAA